MPPPLNTLRLVGIQPVACRRLGATLLLAKHSILDPEYFLHNYLVRPLDARQERLKSRHPFAPAAWKLLDNASELYIHVDQWTDVTKNMKNLNSPSKLHDFIPRVGIRPLGLNLLKPARARPNRLRFGIGRFWLRVHKMGSRYLLYLRVWCTLTNCRPHHFCMPYTPGTKRTSWPVTPG